MITKGFVDLQVNGYMGVDFSGPGLTLDDVRRVTKGLLKKGTIAYCPTVVTADEEVYRANLPLLAQATEEPDLAAHILGIHLEGPFISSLDGPRGAHPKDFVRRPNIEDYKRFQEWAGGKIVFITLAPEREGARELIRYIVKEGIATVSLGHHLADDEDLRMASGEGASCCTHLGNGISNELSRHPNPLWAQLANDSLSAMFITDGHHLPPAFIKVALRAKGVERFIVTSDVASVAGLLPGEYFSGGQEVVLEKSGLIRTLRGDSLAGSSSLLLDCVNHLSSMGMLSEEELYQVGFFNPLRTVKKSLDESAYHSLPNIVYEQDRFKIILSGGIGKPGA